MVKLKHYVSKATLISVYYSLIYPYLTYACTFWGNNQYIDLAKPKSGAPISLFSSPRLYWIKTVIKLFSTGCRRVSSMDWETSSGDGEVGKNWQSLDQGTMFSQQHTCKSGYLQTASTFVVVLDVVTNQLCHFLYFFIKNLKSFVIHNFKGTMLVYLDVWKPTLAHTSVAVWHIREIFIKIWLNTPLDRFFISWIICCYTFFGGSFDHFELKNYFRFGSVRRYLTFDVYFVQLP